MLDQRISDILNGFITFESRKDLPDLNLTRSDLKKLNSKQLFNLYVDYVNDEMSPIFWRGLKKDERIEIIMQGSESEDGRFVSRPLVRK